MTPAADPLEALRLTHSQWSNRYLDQIEPDDYPGLLDCMAAAIAAWEGERAGMREIAEKLRAWGLHEAESEHTNPKARIKAFLDCADSIGMISPGTQLVPKSDLDTLRAEVLKVAEEMERLDELKLSRGEMPIYYEFTARLRKACE